MPTFHIREHYQYYDTYEVQARTLDEAEKKLKHYKQLSKLGQRDYRRCNNNAVQQTTCKGGFECYDTFIDENVGE